MSGKAKAKHMAVEFLGGPRDGEMGVFSPETSVVTIPTGSFSYPEGKVHRYVRMPEVSGVADGRVLFQYTGVV